MKSVNLFGFVLLSLLILSCNKDGDDGIANELANVKSSTCTNVINDGPTAAYWNYAQGQPIPLSRVPVLANPGVGYSYPGFPYLGFTVPQGYFTREAQYAPFASLGVEVVRNDNAVVWRYVPSASFSQSFTEDDIIKTAIDRMFSHHQFTGTNYEVVCKPPIKQVAENGIRRRFNSRLIRFGNFTGVVWVNVIDVEGLPSRLATLSFSSGPTTEYDNLVMDIFLPLSFQLLVSDKESLSDRDNDGTPDVYDREPDNPKVQ